METSYGSGGIFILLLGNFSLGYNSSNNKLKTPLRN